MINFIVTEIVKKEFMGMWSYSVPIVAHIDKTRC